MGHNISFLFFEIVGQEKVQNSLGYIAVLGVIGTGLSNILFFKLIQLSSPVFASSVTYIIPVVAFTLGSLFMNETVRLFSVGLGRIFTSIEFTFSSILFSCKGSNSY